MTIQVNEKTGVYEYAIPTKPLDDSRETDRAFKIHLLNELRLLNTNLAKVIEYGEVTREGNKS